MSAGTFIPVTTSLVTEECCNCHMLFAMPEDFRKRAKDDPAIFFYCPAGHSQHSLASEVQRKLREAEQQLANERAALQRQAEELKRVRGERDHHWIERKKLTTRTRNLKTRIKNGVCPCCNRSFENLHRHMTTQHPGFAAETPTESEAKP